MRDRWPFGGFPWGAVGTTQGGVPGVRWLAGSVGVYGLSFLAAFVAAVVADRIVHGAWPLGSLGLVAGITVVFAVVDAAAYGSPPPGEQLRVVAIQSDVPRPRHAGEDEVIVADHIRLTREAVARSRPDLVVWPESAVGDSTPRGRIAALADEIGVPMLVGRYEADTEREAFLNLVELISEVGTYEAVYQKQHPVPFGEHVPLAFLRRYVTTLDQVPYDMVPGPGPRVFDVDGVRVATPICFESVFPRDMRAFARLGAEVVVVATNDASFERSYASEQHLAHTRMRALELRQWAVQSAISGISAVVAPDGTVSQRSELFEPAVIEAVVRARPASSLYTRVGDLYGWGWTAGTALAFGLWFATTLSGRRRRDDAAQASVDRETVG
jgi:apolipoprotein N-acyltransferase